MSTQDWTKVIEAPQEAADYDPRKYIQSIPLPRMATHTDSEIQREGESARAYTEMGGGQTLWGLSEGVSMVTHTE